MEKKIFAFDLGKTSIGYAVRQGHNIKTVNSIIIDKDHSEIVKRRERRRAKKLLISHKAREEYFNKIWLDSGLLIPNDLTKEFPSKNEEIIYTSCLLRIALLQNKKLENWQIYKALYNAIQKRGYDSNLPWKTIQTEDDKKNLELLEKYDTGLIKSDEFKFPCYYDALKLGLWDENDPYNFKNCTPLDKIRTCANVAPRSLVIRELSVLFENAKKQLPSLQKYSTEEFLYGTYREQYGSYLNPEYRKFMGTDKDLQGVLGQKIPRFNNRIISKCKLLPKRNVCKASSIENVEFVLLFKLKNLRFTLEDGSKMILSPEDIKLVFENWQEKMKNNNGKLETTITKQEIQKLLNIKILDKIQPLKANISGRSSLCRRACTIIKEIILSGKNPKEIDVSKFTDPACTRDGIFEDEIKNMLSKIGDYENLYIPDNRDESFENIEDIRIKTDLIIGGITNSIVKNRLQIFRDLLFDLKAKYNTPNEVIFEFARDKADNSLAGRQQALQIEIRQRENYKENELIKKELETLETRSKEDFLKLKLMRAQGARCIYSGKPIEMTNLADCEIDHIVPRGEGGCDALYNLVLCYGVQNQKKGKKTPYEWLSSDEKLWAEYVNRLNKIPNLSKKKFELLTSSNAKELIESYNALAETAYIARIAQQITAVVFGWNLQAKNEKRHIFVNNGRQTSEIRRRYKLNSLLGDDYKKNRENDKHHALDAICISYANDFIYDKNSNKYTIAGFDRENVKNIIDNIIPYPYTHKKPLKVNISPKDTIYGKRIINNVAYITNRVSIEDIDKKKVPNIIDEAIKKDLLGKLDLENKQWKEMLKNYIHPNKKTKVKKVMIEVSKGALEVDSNGRERIGEYADFGNKGTKGQFKCSKSHKGQIVYFNDKSGPKVMPVFSNQKIKEVEEKLSSMGCKLYKKGVIFSSGCLLNIKNDFTGGKNSYPKGIYKLRTMRSKGTVLLENCNGLEIPTSVVNLVKADFEKA